MFRTVEFNIHGKRPGIVRRFWWRADQRARLAMTCLGALAVLATTGAVGIAGEEQPREPRSTGAEAAVYRGDSFEAVVHAVSEVDSFDGVEPATGLYFRARVAGLRRTGCLLAESREVARNLLRGKKVRLVVKKDSVFENDRMAVDVVLPDGADYARTVVHDGYAPSDPSDREDLAVVEAAARQERRGLWSADCAADDESGGTTETTTASSAPSSAAPAPITTTAVVTTTEPVMSTPPSTPAVSTAPLPPGSWLDGLPGRSCYVEGARRTSANGDEMVCERDQQNKLRWRRVR